MTDDAITAPPVPVPATASTEVASIARGARASRDGPGFGFDTTLILMEEEMFLSLVLRIIFQAKPAVPSSSVSAPALALAYYASHMAFLGGDFRGGPQSVAHDLLTKMFLQTKVRNAPQRKGWQRLCRMFLVGERALYLSGRRKGSHFAGHPDSVPRSLEQLLNPAGKD